MRVGDGPAVPPWAGRGPAAVLWDMDGTLVDSERLWDVSLAELAGRLGGQLSARTRERMIGGALDATLGLLFAEVGLSATPDGVADAGRWLTMRTGQLFAGDLRWCPGAREALELVRAAGLPTALVTSTQRTLTERVLDRIGREHFDVVVCGDEVTATKPAPEPYLRAAALLGVPAHRCVAVEDSPTGTAAAVAAGCTVLIVSNGALSNGALSNNDLTNNAAVPTGPGRVHRDGLIGLTMAELSSAWVQVAAEAIPHRKPIRHRVGRSGDTDRVPPVAGLRPSTDDTARSVDQEATTSDTCGGREHFL